MSMLGRAYKVPQSHAYGRTPQAACQRPQLVGYLPQLVGAYPQLVGAPVGGGYDATQLMGTNPGSNGTYLVDGQPTQTRQWPLPLSRLSLQGGATGTASATAQLMCRPVRLFIGVSGIDIADLSITDIFVGQRSQLINGGGGSLPADMFNNVAVDSLVNFDTAQIGNQIAVKYENEDGDTVAVVRTTLNCVAAAY